MRSAFWWGFIVAVSYQEMVQGFIGRENTVAMMSTDLYWKTTLPTPAWIVIFCVFIGIEIGANHLEKREKKKRLEHQMKMEEVKARFLAGSKA